MSVVVQKDVGSPTALTAQLKRKVVRVMAEIDATGSHKLSIAFDEWREDAIAGIVGTVGRNLKSFLETELGNPAKADIDAIFTRALAAI